MNALEAQSNEPAFWNDPQAAQGIMRELSSLRNTVSSFGAMESRAADAQALIELAAEANDADASREAESEVNALGAQMAELELELMFSGKHDHADALLTIQPGAGGTDAQDWAEMMYRMYVRWAEAKGFKVSEIDYTPADVAGVKNVTLGITGEKAYGWLRSERGTHRLVRMSPFNAGGTRETSFARVEVFPDLRDEEIEIEISPGDLEIDTYRSQGAGGQNVQKNESAVRIRHIPSGIVVTCQDQRSQTQNRERAMHVLKVRLFEIEQRKRDDEMRKLRGEPPTANFGDQIRNYVLHPYQLVKDLRTDHETSQAQNVLNGELDPFMEAYLQFARV